MLNKRPDESQFEYHKRLVYGKMKDKTLADKDYSELAPLIYGVNYSSDTARKAMYGSLKTIELLDSEKETYVLDDGDRAVIAEMERRKIELKKEQQKFFDQRNALNKAIRERARAEEVNEMIVSAIQSGNLPKLEPHDDICFPWEATNDLLVSLNDIHYGAVVDNYWCKYNSDICRQMMQAYIEKIVAIAREHQSGNCFVWANGDMISGNIHYEISMNNRENLIQQVMGVSELIAQFLTELSPHFQTVYFTSVAGNHSRIGTKDQSLLNERLDDLIQWYLEARMGGLHNVFIGFGDKIDTTMYAMDIRGKNYVGVHGDYDPSPANIQTLQQMVGRPVYAVLCGHLHHNMTNVIQGIKTIMAGSFQGMDNFCVQRRIYGKPQQMVCVCDSNGIRCSYDIDLEITEDKKSATD